MIWAKSDPTKALCQCEILTGLPEYRPFDEDGVIKSRLLLHPYAVIMTQACDLEWDYEARESNNQTKYLPNILFCQVTTANKLRESAGMNADLWRNIKRNKNERYQVLSPVPDEADSEGKGLPALGVDFKKYFTLPTQNVYDQIGSMTSRRSHLQPPYSQHLSHRFAYFVSRVALPS